MNAGRLGSLTVMTALLAAMGPFAADQHIGMMEEPVCYVDYLDEVPKRGGRWRAVLRWRNWWATERRPATRRTSRRPI